MSGNDRVAAEIRAEMARQRVSIRSIAAAMGEPPSTVARKLRGETALDVDEVEAFAAALGVTVVDLMARAFTVVSLPTPPSPISPAPATVRENKAATRRRTSEHGLECLRSGNIAVSSAAAA